MWWSGEVGTVTEVLSTLRVQDLLAVDAMSGQVLIRSWSMSVPVVDLDAGTVGVVEMEGLFDAG